MEFAQKPENFDDDWLSKGTAGGALIRNAEERVRAVSSDLPLLLGILDVSQADPALAGRLEGQGSLHDMLHHSFATDWREERLEERRAFAQDDAESFRGNWPEMRRRLREASLVALVAAIDAYVISLFVEFPEAASLETAEERWNRVDRVMHKEARRIKSTSAAWILVASRSSLPPHAKKGLESWKEEWGAMIDDMTLVRNRLVHRPERLPLTDQKLESYRRACSRLLRAVDPIFPLDIL